jgi:hypothetical protein
MSNAQETFKQYLEKNGKTLEDNNMQEEFAKYMGQCLLNKVEVTIGSTTHVTEFENGKRTDYTLTDFDNVRKEAQKIMDELI